MSISRAVTEIRTAQSPLAQRRHRRFRAQQRALDGLIGDTEGLVMAGRGSVPAALRRRVELLMVDMHGRIPPWLDRVTAPTSMLDQLLVAEGRLRQQYYVGVHVDLDDPA